MNSQFLGRAMRHVKTLRPDKKNNNKKKNQLAHHFSQREAHRLEVQIQKMRCCLNSAQSDRLIVHLT